MMTHDQLIFCIQQIHPDLVHGQDFWAAHPVAHGSNKQLCEAEIMQWSAAMAQPTNAALRAIWTKKHLLYETQQVKQAALTERDRRLAVAANATRGLQDAYVAGLLSPAEAARFKAWASYQRALMAIERQTGFPHQIDWPIAPAEKEAA